MATQTLTVIEDFDPNVPFVPLASGFCYNDNTADPPQVIIAVADLMQSDIQTNGAVLTIQFATDFILAEATSTTVRDRISTAFLEGGDGIAEREIVDENITTLEQAQALADAEIALEEQVRYTLTFATHVEGYAPGDQFLLTSEDDDLSVEFITQNVATKWDGHNGDNNEYTFTITAMTDPLDPDGLILQLLRRLESRLNQRKKPTQNPE